MFELRFHPPPQCRKVSLRIFAVIPEYIADLGIASLFHVPHDARPQVSGAESPKALFPADARPKPPYEIGATTQVGMDMDEVFRYYTQL